MSHILDFMSNKPLINTTEGLDIQPPEELEKIENLELGSLEIDEIEAPLDLELETYVAEVNHVIFGENELNVEVEDSFEGIFTTLEESDFDIF